MTSLGKTIAALSARRKLLVDKSVLGRSAPDVPSRLAPLTGFEPNPGALWGYFYLPEQLKPGAPLVVVLHGCMQTAASYDVGSGWSALADREGFALLLPEQSRTNNPNLCFNWFQPGDAARDAGEAASIHAMIVHLTAAHGLDQRRIFVTGLSAGGAMAATLLACYPKTFEAGAIIAGLPHGVARSVPQAFEAMKGKAPSDATLRKLVPDAGRKGPWPRLSIWHGTEDTVVAPDNAEALLVQWHGVHKTAPAPDMLETVDGAEHRAWRGPDGRTTLELWTIPGMGHGAPIAPAKDGLGQQMPYMLTQKISSTARIASFFGLTANETAIQQAPTRAKGEPGDNRSPVPVAAGVDETPPTEPASDPAPHKVIAEVLDKALPNSRPVNVTIKNIIDLALRRAGLR